MLVRLLRKESDCDHPMTTCEICSRLMEEDISCERRTLGKDIRLLREHGYDIRETQVGHQKAYWIVDHCIELDELQALIDAVIAAEFLSEQQKATLFKKIGLYAGVSKDKLVIDNTNSEN